MSHLTIDDVIRFVSSCDLDAETIQIISKVNQHIRKCNKCLQKVKAFQVVYDEFIKYGDNKDFEKYLYTALKERRKKQLLENKELENDYKYR